MDLSDVYEKKGEHELSIEAMREAVATGKVDFMFADGSESPEELSRRIREWEEKQK